MTSHSFDVEVAAEVGLNAATVYSSVQFWIRTNHAKGVNFHEGKTWCFNSVREWEKLFPYLSSAQVRRALDKLVDHGFLGVGNFNGTTYDRTKWFCDLRQLHLAKLANGVGRISEPIPDTNTDTDTDTPIPPEGGLFSEQEIAEKPKDDGPAFDEFWEAYPSCQRKVGKAKAKKLFSSIINGKHKSIEKTDASVMLKGLKAWAASNPDPQYIPMPTTWLNDERWMAFLNIEGSRRANTRRAPDWEERVQ